ncbi:aminotransferase class I/II-fold pyridoxal phosphate-dependent enzyme [Evansella tamaricis]|uniref:Aminotransferase class I/II-fold pyridoxal phosphate-dependent enzyme n=1 Tax=Evansella tamaricis TaxID=2069301 RepID=A0ABS6JIK4_9BACI|nr:aminotransferase class I/II-fold pyridoxal phosphate-dependent enzyme [Evansella tamaricis]MBU9712163.1 aminotransferase class I/II-fold pyridoxal phosphate-dependent enzyme [Evansella tamaricis]
MLNPKLPLKSKIHLSSPHMSGNEMKYIEEAFQSNWIAPVGPNIDAFEREIESYIGDGHAVAVSSGTAAIHLALLLLDVKRGDTVFCSTLTFVASANPVLYQGAEPIFIDSEPETWNMSPKALKNALEDANASGKLPKAVIVVHLYGQMANIEEIINLCAEFNVPIIEDSAESLGTFYKGISSGTFGDFGIFSFNGNKIITASSGGMLICKDKNQADRALFLATQAKDPALHYQHSSLGFNYRMSNIIAGIGRSQLEVLESRVLARRCNFEKYKKALASLPGIQFMPEIEYSRPNRWLTTFTINEKESGISPTSLMKFMLEENIEVRPVWKPLHLQPLFQGCTYYPHQEGGSVSEQLFFAGICLPSGSNMSMEDILKVINLIKYTIYNHKRNDDHIVL